MTTAVGLITPEKIIKFLRVSREQMEEFQKRFEHMGEHTGLRRLQGGAGRPVHAEWPGAPVGAASREGGRPTAGLVKAKGVAGVTALGPAWLPR